MPGRGSGSVDSGLDRALQRALANGLDKPLESGRLRGEPEIEPRIKVFQNWQRGMGETPTRPGLDHPVIADFWERVAAPFERFLRPTARPSSYFRPSRSPAADKADEVGEAGGTEAQMGPQDAATIPPEMREAMRKAELYDAGVSAKSEHQWEFRDNLTGIVMVHGIGPQLAGQTLLDWTRPIITAIADAAVADAASPNPKLYPLSDGAEGITDPVFRSNIDFSGETFPVIQVRVPRRRSPAPSPAGSDSASEAAPPSTGATIDTTPDQASIERWIFSETWWAAEVRPPSLRTMVGWLGDQGGVGRIVQGIQRNTLGDGPMRKIAELSVQPFVSVIVSFALLTLVVLLAVARLIPFGPLRTLVTLRIASTFLTDWFGGARTLLRDPAQSANVRGRMVMTIKALRAYGCRRVVVVAHSGGTIVSLTTLTDPAYPNVEVDKLITIGEALNLGWRLEAKDSDAERPTPAPGNRLLGNLSAKPRLFWRDFWATHDPAPSGSPCLPLGTDAGKERFLAERVYNRMSIGGDHGGYWDNDEQFVIPLIREIDVPNGGREGSRFYDAGYESVLRARRKERVGILALGRRAMLSLPVMAILAAAIVTTPGFLPAIGQQVTSLLGAIPFSLEIGRVGDELAKLGKETPLGGFEVLPASLREVRAFDAIYGFGLLILQFVFLFALFQASVPNRVDGLWWDRWRARAVILTIDVALGIGALLVILVLSFVVPGGLGGRIGLFELVKQSGLFVLAGVGVGVFAFALVGERLRRWLRGRDMTQSSWRRPIRAGSIAASAAFLGIVLLLLTLALVGVILVYAGNIARSDAANTRDFVVGALVVVGLFSLIGRIGEWRWDTWDIRERRALRRRPRTPLYRLWPAVVTIALAVLSILVAILMAVGRDGAHFITDRATWSWLLLAYLVILIFMTLGKDVVDNDIDTDDGSTGGAGSGRPRAEIMPRPDQGDGGGVISSGGDS